MLTITVLWRNEPYDISNFADVKTDGAIFNYLTMFAASTETSMRVVAVVPGQTHCKHHREARAPAKRTKALLRIVVNLNTCTSVFLISCIIATMDVVGFFSRRSIINDLAQDASSMASYGQSCRLDANGFMPGTCSSLEIETTTSKPAWAAIGRTLALQWPPLSSPSSYFVTTCIKTKPTNSGQIAMLFLGGTDRFPQCQPSTGPQEIAGMAMLETTIRDEFPTGAFQLTLFADQTMIESQVHVNSDRSTDRWMAKINQMLIATNGSVAVDSIGINSKQYSTPLGELFKVSTYSYPVVLDITNLINPSALAGWNVGRQSKKAVIMTWNYAHEVSNRSLLVTLQLGSLATGCILISGDYYLTIQGLRGFLAHKPVMTFDLAAGLERRKIVLLFWVFCGILLLVYPDIVCMTYGSTALLWIIICLPLGAFYLCCFFLCLGLVTCIPSPFTHVVTLSSNFMIHMLYVVLEVVYMIQLPDVLDHYRSAPMALSLNISGVLRPSGAYANGGKVDSALVLLIPSGLASVAACMVLSILLSTFRLKRSHGTYLLNLEWTRSNNFITKCGPPNWISGLPLHIAQMIKIGNKLYCKPSGQVTLGYATIATHREDFQGCATTTTKANTIRANVEENELALVSVYKLLAILCSIHRKIPRILRPMIFGTVKKYEFKPDEASLIHTKEFAHHRGTCVN
ncbi:hypothetical protein LEN26_001685 [Aphanomyces euteiches]|nr:hypothetical protein AeMF1_019231 [Aphanomyces euteiches]KAH9160864.1 hypothetical protein LEN26_001685 [Aphanomyces euteiches]KAH9187161.1 hypothetical protein AeNC1_010864 [Aphanomyces euteiches]